MKIRSGAQEGASSVGKLQSGGGRPPQARGRSHRHVRTRDGRITHGGHKIVDQRIASALQIIAAWPDEAYQNLTLASYGGGRAPSFNAKGNVAQITIRRRTRFGDTHMLYCRFKAGSFRQILIFHTTKPDVLEQLIRGFNEGDQ